MGVFNLIQEAGHDEVVFCNDPTTGLKAIIAIHDTTLGPALGGCRMWNYENEDDALRDVLRLSRGMTYKAAITGLNLGGGKSVIIGDPKELKNEALFKSFGKFVESLGGRYITAEDVNIRVEDMEVVATETRYVTGISSHGGSGDPSPITALGVFHGIKASVKHRLGKDSLAGLKVAVQGVGAVGGFLCELLNGEGARILVSDINEAKVAACVEKYGAEPVANQTIHTMDVDVYAPCALGGILNDETIPELKTPIVAGGANNQLLDEKVHGELIKKRGILYAPDYAINAGGLINVYHELKGYNEAAARKMATGIFDTMLKVYNIADSLDITTIAASNRLAEERVEAVRNMKPRAHTMDNQLWIEGNL